MQRENLLCDLSSQDFGKLAMTSKSRALIGLYQGQVACKKTNFGQPEKEVKNWTILGVGLMSDGGTGIAKTKQQGKENEAHVVREGLDLCRFCGHSGFHRADLVIEAVSEEPEIKHKVLKEAEAVFKSVSVRPQ